MTVLETLRQRAQPWLERLGVQKVMPSSRVVDIGWLLKDDDGAFIWDDPRPFPRSAPTSRHAKSAAYCPAILDYESRIIDVPCPYDLRLGLRLKPEEEPALVNLDGDNAAVRSNHIGRIVKLMARKEWRHPERPVLQMPTPYVFLADEPVWLNQMPPFGHFPTRPWPGLLMGGRFPIHIWPRPLMWAFEWHNLAKPLELRRGEPWFSLRFETMDPSRPVRLVEAEPTPELKSYMAGVSGVTNMVRRTFSLFPIAEKRRPARLLKKRSDR
jgi:hypothetical protein